MCRDRKKEKEKLMEYDIILAGVGGQGVLSMAAIISMGAMEDGLHVRQSEVHGMAQRGGAVLAHLRLSSRPISSDLIPRGRAGMILSLEPLESLRYLSYLSPGGGIVVTSKNPVKNITVYPDLEKLYDTIRDLEQSKLIDAEGEARKAGTVRAANMVMVGAASGCLPVKPSDLEKAIAGLFKSKGKDLVDVNIEAFRMGQRS